MAPHRGLDPSEISSKARKDILRLLEGVRGKKNLVIQRALAGPVGLFVKFSSLQEHGVDRVFFLENENVDSSQQNVVFLARAEKAKQVSDIAEQINRLRRNGQTAHDFSIFWVPRRTLVSDKILEEAGVLGDVNIAELPLYFFPLGNDLLSLQLEDSFSDLYLRRDPGPIFLAAKALMLLQRRHGLFPRIIGKGDGAKRLADLLIRMRLEVKAGEDSASDGFNIALNPSGSIEALIIVDREVDFASALLTQLTYEGLVDEIFGIENNQTDVDSSIVGALPVPQSQRSSSGDAAAVQPVQATKRKIQLDSSDKLYEQLRDSNFSVVGSILNKAARRLQSEYDSRHGTKSATELREFVSKLPGYQAEQQSLKIHTNLAEEITKQTRTDIFNRVLEVQQNLAAGADPSTQHDNIEELIARDCPLPTVLRLLCLESCMSGGLRPRDLDNSRRQLLHGYGHQHLLTLDALEKLHLLQPQSGGSTPFLGLGAAAEPQQRTNYTALRKPLRLIFDEVNEQEPDDIAYVFSGYAPLSVRLVQCVLQKSYVASLAKPVAGKAAATAAAVGTPANDAAAGWRGFEDVLKSVKGKTVDEAQEAEDKDAVRARESLRGAGAAGKTVVVFFLGGITCAEVAALRYVARQAGKRIVICTTGMVSGDRVVGAAVERGAFGGGGRG